MANNRLYVGNRKTKEYSFLSKGFGTGWVAEDAGKNLENFLDNTHTFGESNFDDTSLFFFTEQSEEWDEILDDWTQIKSLPYKELDK